MSNDTQCRILVTLKSL